MPSLALSSPLDLPAPGRRQPLYFTYLRTLKQGLCGEAALRKTISRWHKDEWIEKVDKTHWKKLNAA